MRRHLDRTFMRSKQGIFSALVYRFVSFDSPAFTEYPGPNKNCKFFSMDDWKRYYDDLKKHFPQQDKDFFCNPKNSGKEVEEYVLRFWNTCNDCSWIDESRWPLAFKEMRDKMDVLRVKGLLPGFDDEDVYQLCVDMVYYDLVSSPTVDDVVEDILHMNGDSLGGLVVLGYLGTGEERSFPETRAAFRAFYDDFYILSVAGSVELVNVDVIQVENVLSCFYRLWNTGFYHNAFPLPFQIQ